MAFRRLTTILDEAISLSSVNAVRLPMLCLVDSSATQRA